MVIILSIGLTLFWIEKVVARNQLENHACQGPDISTLVIVATENYLRRAVFSSLNNIGVMVILITGIAHITKFDFYILLSHSLDIIMTSWSHLFCSLILCMQSLHRVYPQKSTLVFFRRMHQYVLWVGILDTLLRCLLKESVLIFKRSRAHYRYASFSFHAWYHLVLGLDLLNLFTEFCNNYFSFGFSCLL
jgi:hypothetical protein